MTISSLQDASQTIRCAIAMQVLEQSVVMFSQNYLPLCRVNIRQAIVPLVIKQGLRLSFVAQDRWRVDSPTLVIENSSG